MNVYIVLDYPTLDETRKYALGAVLATSEDEARNCVIDVLRAHGLGIPKENLGDIVLELWDDSKEAVRIFFQK